MSACKASDAVDAGAIVLLCLSGLVFTLLIFVAGSPKYGVLSTISQNVGIGTLLGYGFSSFVVAALVLRRLYRVASSRPNVLLVVLTISASPFVFFLAILAGRFIHGE